MQHHYEETLQDKKNSSNVARIDESVQRIALYKLNYLLDITRETEYANLLSEMRTQNNLIFRHAAWRNSGSRSKCLPSLNSELFPQQTSTHSFEWVISLERSQDRYAILKSGLSRKKTKFAKKGPDGPKGAPKMKRQRRVLRTIFPSDSQLS